MRRITAVTRSACNLALVLLLLVAALSGSAADGARNAVTKFTLPNGVRLIVQPDSNSDVVALCVFVKAGVAEEGATPGIGTLVSRALFGSNYNQSSEAVTRAIYGVGGSLETVWDPDYTLITCVTTRENFADATYVISQALKNALFEQEEVDRVRRDMAADLARAESDPFKVAYAAMRAAMYPDSPYRLPFGGTSDTLRRLTQDRALRFYQARYTPGNTVVAVVGNLTPEAVRATIENQLLPDYDRVPPRAGALPTPTTPSAGGRAVRKLPIHTVYLLAGFQAPGVIDPDYPAFAVLDAIIGSGRSSRLFRTVRDTAGIGYEVGCLTPPLARESYLLAYVEYDPARIAAGGKRLDSAAVERLVVETVQSALKSPPTAEEVERAKRFVTGTHALAHQRARDRAFHLGWYELIGAGYEFDTEFPRKVAAVSPADVERVAKKYLTSPVISIVEPDK